ncbi:MAG TPA: DUF1707 domain-containing protein [Gemmatimonadaceae bacterium]|nr:DUF1707 domain-containing protein [Gemmatimonadaceae bacterium]
MPNTPLPAPPRPAGSSRLPPTEEERERVASFLSARFADDALSLDAFEERVAAVYRVSTMAELNALTADLAPAAPAASGSLAPRRTAMDDRWPEHGRRFAILANLEHHSMAVAPRHLALSAVLGNVEIDLRDAKFGGGTTEIHVQALLGHIAVTLPAGTRVEQQASGILGSIECPPSPWSRARRDAPLVRLTGRVLLGAVEIRYAEPSARVDRGLAGLFPRVDRPRGRR